jgi:plasmid stability protein
MRITYTYVQRVPKMIQLRDVPDALHRKLKARAALEGLSLSDFLLREVRKVAERPTLSELQARLSRRASVTTRESPAKAVRSRRAGARGRGCAACGR